MNLIGALCVPHHQACKPSSVPDLSVLRQSSILASGCPDALAIRQKHAGPASRFLSMLLRIGFTGPRGLPRAGELLPRLSTLTIKAARCRALQGRPQALWRYLSVALSLRSPSAAVSRYPALWSSDFPQASSARDCPACSCGTCLFYPVPYQKSSLTALI